MESGAYFAGQGAHVIIGEFGSKSPVTFTSDASDRQELLSETRRISCLCADESFAVSQMFELVFELRPSNQNGLLLHVGNADHHLTVYMRKGEVGAVVQFSTVASASVFSFFLSLPVTDKSLEASGVRVKYEIY